MTIRIRRADFSDRSKILEFHQSGEGELFKYRPARWDWAFSRNPFLRNLPPKIWLALEGDRVVGQYCGLAVDFLIAGESVSGMWGVDHRVLEEYRGKGLGQQLKLQAYEEEPLVMSLWTSSESRALTLKIGGIQISEAVMYRLNLSNWKMLPRSHDFRVEEVTQFTSDIDRLFEQVVTTQWSGVRRSQQYLNWKFFEQPAAGFHGFVLFCGGMLTGYSVIRCGRPPEEKIGLIAEAFTAPHDTAGQAALILHAIEFFSSQGMRSVQVAASDPSRRAVIQELGFIQKDVQPCFAHVRPQLLGVARAIQETATWDFGNGDSDWDQFPYSLMPD